MNDHADCHALLQSLSEYIDSDLDPELCKLIDQHLASCENCRIVVDSLRKTISLYQTVQSQQPDLPEQVRERLFVHLHLDEFLHK